MFLDTFIDHDRGYYPRYGLLDRRYNPRTAFYVFRHLQYALGQHEIKINKIEASADIRAFTLDTSQYRCVLLYSEEDRDLTELDLAWIPRSNLREGSGK